MSASNVIDLSSRVTAVNDATANNTPCGAIVFWALRGGTTVEAMTAALTDDNGILAFAAPRPVSEKVAMTRACEIVARRHGLKCQPISKVGADTETQAKTRARATAGWALSRPLAVQDDGMLGELRGPIVARAKSGSVVRGVRVGAGFEGDGAIVAELKDEHVRALSVLTPEDVSVWLCDTLQGFTAFSLKPGGGCYFVPADAKAVFDTLCNALKSTSHSIYTIPALRSDTAIEAILAALESNMASAIEAIAQAVAAGDVGKCGLETKERELSELLTRLTKYEGLLGRSLDGVRAQAEEAEGAIAVAMLAAQ